ncbi:MAG TPA: CoA-binding protein [Thermomicrobiales bacterium]
MTATANDGATLDLTPYQDTATILEMLRSARTIAIVGLSSNPLRASHFVGFYLQRHGYRIIPVNPRETEVLGERSYPSLLEVPEPIDIVDVFRTPDAVPGIAREAVQVGAKVLWLQYNIISPEGIAIAEQGGMKVIVDRCMKVEHARHLGRMHWLGFNTGIVTAKRAGR